MVISAARTAAATTPPAAPAVQHTFAIRMLMLYLVLEYIRPLFLAELKLQMVIVVGMVALWFAAKDRPWSSILTAQVLFFVVCAQAIPFAWNNFAAYFTTRIMLGHLVIALALSWLVATRPSLQRISWAWLLIMGYVAVYGILHGGSGPGAMLGDENDMALACATAFPFAFFGLQRLTGRARWLCAAIAGLLVVAIVVSFSRGGFVALVVVGVYCWWASKHKVRSVVLVILTAALVMVAAPERGRTGESYVDRLRSMFNTDEGTAEGRQFLWRAATNMWRAHPLVGVGGGNFPFLVGQYQPLDFDKPEYLERDWSGTVTHSLYFQVLAEHGLAGISLLAFIMWMHFRTLRRLRLQTAAQPGLSAEARRDIEMYAGALGGAVVGYCAAAAFLSVAYYPYLWYFSAMAVGLEAVVQKEIAALPGKAA
jgi:O-antigen ligase